MNQPEPVWDSTARTRDHLDLLAIFHYVVAGLGALFACIPIIHVILGIAIMSGALQDSGGPPPFFGLLFAIVGAIAVLMGWALAVLIFMAGQRLKERRGYTFCLVVAAIECLMFPIGTILGVFTLIVLNRPEARPMFEGGGGG